jgi:hypothetical protein
LIQAGKGPARQIAATEFTCDKPYTVKAAVSDGDFNEFEQITFVPNPSSYFVFSDTSGHESSEKFEHAPGTEAIEIEMTLVEDAAAGCESLSEFNNLDVEVVLMTSDGSFLIRQPAF